MQDLVCFSHLRWDFVFQRPQHLLTRAAKDFRVFYVEEFSWTAERDSYSVHQEKDEVNIVKISLHEGNRDRVNERLADLLEIVFNQQGIREYFFWYYTPMALSFTGQFSPRAVIYDCMDELSAFKFADPQLSLNETQLFELADVVFTGGESLYEAKKHQHPNVHCFPSSIDFNHFARARNVSVSPADQDTIPSPRLGFFGVIDERFDIDLIREAATLRPDLQFVLVGPIVKINPDDIPKLPNIHLLGGKKYSQLPDYIAGWDIAIMPFALNESTKFISPTKTPEYLAAGRPVISTAVRDVVKPYGEAGLVHIVSSAAELVDKADLCLSEKNAAKRRSKVDEFLAGNSWDLTWAGMKQNFQPYLSIQKTA